MLKNAIAYPEMCEDMRIFASALWHNFRIYAILKTQLYAEKYAICGFSQNMRDRMFAID